MLTMNKAIYITYLDSVPLPGKIHTYKNQTEEYDYSWTTSKQTGYLKTWPASNRKKEVNIDSWFGCFVVYLLLLKSSGDNLVSCSI